MKHEKGKVFSGFEANLNYIFFSRRTLMLARISIGKDLRNGASASGGRQLKTNLPKACVVSLITFHRQAASSRLSI